MRKQTSETWTVTAKEVLKFVAVTIAERAGLKRDAIDFREIEWSNGDASWTRVSTDFDEDESRDLPFSGIAPGVN